MGELTIKSDHIRVPLRFASFYELYKRFLKEHGCKWHDISKLLNVVAEILFDVDDACSLLASKVSVFKVYYASTNYLSFTTKSCYLYYFEQILLVNPFCNYCRVK